MNNPTPAETLDAVEQALQGVLPFAEECKHHENNGKYHGKPVFSFNDVPLTFDALNLIPEALTHLATLRQQVADLVAENERLRNGLMDCHDETTICRRVERDLDAVQAHLERVEVLAHNALAAADGGQG